MSDTALVFYLLAKDGVSPALAGASNAWTKFSLVVGASALFAGEKAVHMAADFQTGMTRLVTGAGEARSNMGLVSDGILNMAGAVGESTKDLAAGAYLIESAGYHGADALKVLEISAKGAKVGVADMATVADAVTTALNAYHMGADGAAAATNALIAAEGQGKTTLEALAGSLSTVAPIAAAAHVGLNEVLGAMATMTAQGTSADMAATYLRQTIGQLSNPTGKASQEMKSLGLSSVEVSKNLGTNGLASTLTMLTDAIQKKMGPAGTVLIQHLQAAAKNTTAFQQVLANLPPAQQTYVGALATMVGGTKSMQAALELTGDNMKTFIANTDIINEKVKAGGQTIEGWSDVQKNFNQKLAEAKGTVEALGIRIGTALLPKAQEMLSTTMKIVDWFTRHKDVAKDLAIGIGILAGGMLLYKTYIMAANVATGIWSVATKVMTAAQWLLNLALDANPIGLIIIAVGLLVAGIWLLWENSAGFRDFFIGMWGHIWSFLKAVGAWFAGPFADFFVGVWHAIADAAKWLWHNVLEPFVDFFVGAWHVIADAGMWLWHNVLDPIWHGIQGGIASVSNFVKSFINLWLFVANGVIKAVWETTIRPVFEAIGAVAMWLWQNVFVPVGEAIGVAIGAIGAAAVWLWQNVFVPVGDAIGVVFSAIGTAAGWLWTHAIQPAFNGVAGAAKWVWGILSDAFDLVMDKVHAVGHVFSDIFGAIGGFVADAFTKALHFAKSGLNGVIGLLNSALGWINTKVIDVANKVPGVSFGHIPTIPMLASGGTAIRGGLATVGERGAEVVRLGAGDTVYPHGTGPAGGGGETVYLRPGNELGALLIQVLRTAIGNRGGKTAVVLDS